MSTDSESQSLAADKASRNSATYSICSLDEVPVRKSAVQIIRERSSTDLIQPGSPRRKGTMQITKLVLKDPPTSPKRTKVTPMVIKSIKTFTSSALIAENGQILNDHSNKPTGQFGPGGEVEEYRITPLPQVKAGRLMEEFEAKKNERNQASSDFQNYLLESFNKENRLKTGIEISKATTVTTSAGSANSIQQSGSDKGKSDSSVTTTSSSSSQRSASSSTSASKSEQKPEEQKDAAMPEKTEEVNCTKPAAVKRRPTRPKTADSRKSIPEPKKEKSYDPQKAREFIKEQQAKRKQDKKATTPQMSEKDLIKKRLEDLKKNTRVLVSKNVQKTRKRSISASGASSQKSGSVPLKAVESSKLPPAPAKVLRKSSSTSSLKPAAVGSTKSDSAKSSAGSRQSRRRSSLLKADFTEHMGIMRKPDAVALEEVMMSPLRIRTPPRPLNHPEVITPFKPVEPNESIRNVPEKSVSAIEQELKLDVPEVKLVPDSTVKPHEPPSAEKKELKPVPPWLKHTLLQPDPYPFIMAVRKKLEAIRHLNQNQTAHPDESVIPRKHEESVKRSATANSQKCLEYLETLKSVPYVHKPSDSDQNISSVSLQHSDSNTTSEISSIKSDFILPLPPLSSTKFDSTQPATRETHRPEVGPISPLSVDRISNLKITANSSALERSINFNRGDHMPGADLIPDRISFNNRNVHDLRQSQLSLNTSEKQRNFLQNPLEKSTNTEKKELEYQKMLEAFNRSLTQVIEVNQQLYSALSKPPEPVPPERIKIRDGMTQTTPVPSVANASANSNYSEDFERSDDLKPPNPARDSTESTPEKKSSSGLTTSTSSPSSSSTTGPQSTTSPEDSPAGKTQSSEQSQLLDSRSLSLSDSHNTNPPMPEEYLPSFEESLRQRQQPSPPKATETNPGNSSTSIETQISDEAPDEGRNVVLRETIETESKSLESISMKLSEASEALNDQRPPTEAEVEILKAASSSSADESELEAIEMAKRGTAMNDTTMGSDIMAVFNRTDMEVSIMSTTISEANLSYSSIGLYDQLIQSEKCKGDQLAAHARLKEKALLNRTKGQLAWLELQKQRFREQGMMDQISVIKKKQRAILMRLEKERADLNRLKKSTSEVSSRTSNGRSPMTPKSLEKLNSFSSHSSNSISLRRNSGGSVKGGDTGGINASLVALGDLSTSTGAGGDNRLHQRRRTITTTTTTTVSNSQLQLTAAVRGMELEPSESLEDILQRREQELQKRRQHVQTLLEWHQKLDREEQEILDIERNLLQYNQRKIAESRAADEQTLSRIRSIEKSLQTLQQIPDRPHGSKSSDDDGEEAQAVGGSKLNRLWYRLTGAKENRYDPGRSYSLTKAYLEGLYEEAKQRVLEGFRENEGMRKVLLEQSMSGLNSSGSVGKDTSGVSDQRNTSSEQVHTTVESSEGNSFQTTVNSAELAQESADPSDKIVKEKETKTVEQIEERSSLLDVEDIISRVSDITENINGFLSSTTNIDELLQQEEQQKQLSEDSVEFHTIEDEQDSGSRTKPSSDTYSATFDMPTTIEENRLPPLSAEDNQLMIEDTSLPPMMNDESLLNDESIAESIAESVEKPTEEIPDDASLEEASSTASSATTPTTAEETETEYNDVLGIGKSPAKDSTASELEKRLITLNENLGELNESIERVSAIRSPEVPKSSERPNSSEESESVTPPAVDEEYSTDMDFTAEDRRSSTESAEAKPFLDDIQAIKVPQKQLAEDNSAESHKIEIKIRSINANENFPLPATVGVPSTSGVSSFSYLTPPAHGPSTSTPASVIQNRMPDIINEAEVLRRQQLQIEQEIKQLEQQVVFFREIPNKPPPPYIPPANGSPLALIFPPESRINELIQTRTKELFLDEPAATEMLLSDHVTNIYEKLILDMCKELFTDVRPPSPDVSFRTVRHEKRPLAFHNPPDRLVCLQSYMKQKIKRILNEDSLLQQQQQQHLNLHHCPMPFLMFAGSSAKRKRDQVDEILAQEMFDEEARWTNFDREEIEVKERIVEEVTKMLVGEAVRDMKQAWKEKVGCKQDESILQDGTAEELN